MNIQDINDLANDVAVSRLLINEFEKEIEQLQGYQELIDKISQEKAKKEEAQAKLIDAMKSENLKSWKTEKANFARATRYSVSVDSNYKKQVENRLKEGEEVEGFTLKETEYLSIRKS